MWRKSEHEKPVSNDSSPANSEVPPSTAAKPTQASTAPATVNQHIKIKGEISGRGDFVLDGELEGKVCISDGTFTVGPNARVAAEIEARQIVVRGEVVGSLKAHERIQILSTAKVTGDMDARGIAVEDGAELHSKVAIPRGTASAPVANAVPQSEDQEGTDGRLAPATSSEASERVRGAAAGSPSQADPGKR